MHVCYRSFCGFGGRVQDVSGSAICVEGFVQRHIEVGDCAVCAENLIQVCGSDVLGEFLNDNLQGLC